MDTIVTRFPPSPTGYLHIGGARTALFNWLYARKTKGKFILRIEDTDAARSTKESVDAILESLQWLGIDWDEGPYFQTQRYPIYDEYIEKLIDSGSAYYCSCTPDEVNAMREDAKARGLKPMYNGKCRKRNLKKGDNTVVRLKTPDTGVTIVKDIVKGNTAFQNSEMDDFIIKRSDGSAMYNLAVVIDDLTMGVNTIIRGDDHLINTPKQMLIYMALGADMPVFGHVPMVLGSDKARLSKRHGAMSVGEYKTLGFLPDAMINYLVRLGWSHGDQEFFERTDLIEKFDLEHLGRSASMFDTDKLMALNAKHIQSKHPEELADPLLFHLKNLKIDAKNDAFTQGVIQTLQPRSKTLVEMAQGAAFYYQDPVSFDEKAAHKFLTPDILTVLQNCANDIQALETYTQESLEDVFKKIMEKTDLKFGKIAQPIRVAITGTTVSPGIFEMLLALGRERTVQRIKAAVRFIQDKV
ncbi:MAG: glutamate--tRNA ligase [Proteobacteria bacterium]|nr:glutamate--tRNA ligase [Pseudomonadota bacterium]MBU1584069.1 glutamate--tRNA ligase [Pseudomonadota bacterium]MBU2454051.1 glutamate--tRNA ligase [Pseudomonadota bacterium]MBU2628656.1 glutamate--tRNA ligase [Pseudomonadota bacterium]